MTPNDAQTAAQASQMLDEDADAGAGFEGMGAADFSPAFIRFIDFNNSMVIEGTPEYNKNAKAGYWFNTSSLEVYGPSVNVIPLKMENLWLAWKPGAKGFAGRYAPGGIPVTGDPFKGGMKDAEGNDVQDTMIFYVLVCDKDGKIVSPEIAVISFSSTGLKHARKWNTFIRRQTRPSGKRAAFYDYVWKLESVLNRNDAGQMWFLIGSGDTTKATPIRFVPVEERMELVKPNRDSLIDTSRVDYAQLTGPSMAQEAEPTAF